VEEVEERSVEEVSEDLEEAEVFQVGAQREDGRKA
jgi:hypothetical protein